MLGSMPTMSEPRTVRVEHVMGTVVSARRPRRAPPGHGRGRRRSAWLHEVDARFSTYRADSELCRLDRGELLLADASRGRALGAGALRRRCASETGGFFDVRATGRLDPSALVKGWAAQRAADMLRAAA